MKPDNKLILGASDSTWRLVKNGRYDLKLITLNVSSALQSALRLFSDKGLQDRYC